MGINPITKNMDDKQTQIKCIHVNVKHSMTASANLMKIIEENNTDVICIQEPILSKAKRLEY
jgi:exonuclease III